jgi:hypothetical protein
LRLPPGSGVYLWGALAALAYAGLAWHPAWAPDLRLFFALYAVAWVAALGAARARSGLLPILVGAALFRAALVPVEPTLSGDVYRYVWEGHVQAAGYNPYVVPPAAPELVPLRDATWPRINHPDGTAIYPPLAQLAFRGLAALGGAGAGVVRFKAFLAAVDFAVVVVLAWALHRRRAPAGRLALYAWNPLAVVEVAGTGHVEALALLPLILALLLAPRHRVLGWCALAASVAAKYAALILVPLLARAARPRPLAVAAALAFVTLLTLPYVKAGAGLFSSLRVYIDIWRYNDLLFRILLPLAGSLLRAKLVAAGILATWIAILMRRRTPLEPAALATLAALLVLSPTIHPWYLLWPAVLLPLVPSMPLFAWTGSVCVAYLFLYPAGALGPLAQNNWTPAVLQLLSVAAAFAVTRGWSVPGPGAEDRDGARTESAAVPAAVV